MAQNTEMELLCNNTYAPILHVIKHKREKIMLARGVSLARLRFGLSGGLFGLTLIRAPQGVTATCDISLSACFSRLQTLRGVQRYYQQQPSLVQISAYRRSPCVHHGEQRQSVAIQNSHWCNSAPLRSRGDSGFYLVRREKVQQLADFIVEQRLPLKAGPGHTVLPAPWTLPSGVHVLQAVPNTLKDLQGLSVPLA